MLQSRRRSESQLAIAMKLTMTRSDANRRRFLGSVAKHAVNVYSGLSWMLALLALLPYWTGKSLVFLATALAVLSLFPAFYRSWKEVVLQLPQVGALDIASHSVAVNAPVENRIPEATSHLDIRLEVRNPSGAAVLLSNSVTCEKWGVDHRLFRSPTSVKLYGRDDSGRWGERREAIRFDPEDRRTDLACFVELRPETGDDLEFARALMQQQEWSVTLRFDFETLDRQQASCYVEARFLLDVFKHTVIAAWRRRGHADLLTAAGVDG